MTEINQTDTKFIDTSIWISYFLHGDYRDVIHTGGANYCSVLSLYEFHRKLVRSKVKPRLQQRYILNIQRRAIIVPILSPDAFAAMEFSLMYNLSIADMFIFTSAQMLRAKLVTKDNDFRNLPNVIVLE